MSNTIQQNIQVWRQKCLDGTITVEEMKLAIEAIRKERVLATEKSATAKVKKESAAAKAKPVDSDALLGELGL